MGHFLRPSNYSESFGAHKRPFCSCAIKINVHNIVALWTVYVFFLEANRNRLFNTCCNTPKIFPNSRDTRHKFKKKCRRRYRLLSHCLFIALYLLDAGCRNDFCNLQFQSQIFINKVDTNNFEKILTKDR